MKTFILFPKIPTALKSNYGEECYNPSGLVPRAIKRIKTAHPEVVVCTDVALDPYSSEVSIVVLYGVCVYGESKDESFVSSLSKKTCIFVS